MEQRWRWSGASTRFQKTALEKEDMMEGKEGLAFPTCAMLGPAIGLPHLSVLVP